MIYTIEQLKQTVFEKVYAVYDIFQNFFGEQFTDLQDVPSDDAFKSGVLAALDLVVDTEDLELSGTQVDCVKGAFMETRPFIMVYWPRVTVTNEYDRSVNIQDLYAKIHLNPDGRIPYENRGFLLNRSRYTLEQFRSGYCHSHIPGIPTHNFSDFQQPCLGTGPIRDTIGSLKNEFDESLWMLFCQELANYVTVESLTGGPYRRLENIGNYNRNTSFTGRYQEVEHSPESFGERWFPDFKHCFADIFKVFTEYYISQGHLKLNYKNGHFTCGMPYLDFMVDISNCFIDFFNEKVHDRTKKRNLFNSFALSKVLISEGKIYNTDYHDENTAAGVARYIGSHVCWFKGNDITLSIMEDESSEEITETILLHHRLAMYILTNILKIINYRYRNEHNKREGSTASQTHQTVRYL